MKSSVTHNPALSATLNKYYVDSAGFVGLTLAPLFRSGEQAAFYYVFDRENFLNIPRLAARAPGTPYVRSSMKLSDATFACKNYGSEIPVADEERKKYAVAFDADQAAIRRNGLIMLFNHEVRVKAIYDAAGVPHANAPVKWDDFANAASDPVGDVKAAKRVIQVNSGLMPNVLAMSQTVYDKLTEHPKVKGLYPFADGPLTRDQIRKAFEVDQLIIAGAVENSAAEGQALNPAYRPASSRSRSAWRCARARAASTRPARSRSPTTSAPSGRRICATWSGSPRAASALRRPPTPRAHPPRRPPRLRRSSAPPSASGPPPPRTASEPCHTGNSFVG
ncbi:MAG: major capsid protein [Verrucomicrobia bacterium]|nr:major capsid protein [Verrucomicrobiota bacterium]